MPILSNDPISHPPDKLQVEQTANEWHATFGYPGPAGPASDEVVNNFIIVDMMAKAATDQATPEEAIAWAQSAALLCATMLAWPAPASPQGSGVADQARRAVSRRGTILSRVLGQAQGI